MKFINSKKNCKRGYQLRDSSLGKDIFRRLIGWTFITGARGKAASSCRSPQRRLPRGRPPPRGGIQGTLISDDHFGKPFFVSRSPARVGPSIFGKSAMLNMQANAAVSEQQNCSNSMLKLARDHKVGPLNYISSALHTELSFVFVPL